MGEPVRVGIIGAGMIAQVMHLPHLLELHEQFEVTSLCDLSTGTVRAVAQRFAVPNVYTDHRDLLASGTVDAVLVLTRDHARPAIDAARAGVHVLIEKPMCNNLVEADELVDAVAQSGVVGMVGYHKRYDPGYRYGRERIHALREPHLVRLHDVIGGNHHFLAHYDLLRVDDIDPALLNTLNAEHRASLHLAIGEQPEALMRAYDLMLGLSTHDIAILHGAFPLPTRVISVDVWQNGGAIAALLAWENEMRCVFTTGFTHALRKFDETLTVYSQDRVVEIAFPSPFLKNAATTVEQWEMEGDLYRENVTTASYEEAFKEELRHFYACIRNGASCETPVSEGREDIAFLIQMARAFRS